VFCHKNETIKHLFFECRFTRSIWLVIQFASTLYQPTSIANIFGNWLNGVDDRFKKHIRVGAIAIIWSLWLCKNDKVFFNKSSSLLQVIYQCTHTLRLWSPLQKVEHQDLFSEVCSRWRLRRGILFPYMGGNMTTDLDLLHLRLRHRRFCSISMWSVFSPFFVSFDKTCAAAVCILVM
jgi:hypothetical protein